MDPLTDFDTFPFAHGGSTRTVYRKGAGPAVLVMHEMPGITPEVARFARKVADAGFTVFMPSLFGKPGKEAGKIDFGREFVKACVSREFSLLAKHHSSPVTDWLRALAKDAHGKAGGRGVGAVGMCITGNFALTMCLDPEMQAPVLAQPSLPWPPTGERAAAVHAPAEALAEIRRRHAEDGLKVIGLRFEGDRLCRAKRFETLARELGPAFEPIVLRDESAATRESSPHSVLTKELIDREGEATHDALQRVLSFLRERLL